MLGKIIYSVTASVLKSKRKKIDIMTAANVTNKQVLILSIMIFWLLFQRAKLKFYSLSYIKNKKIIIIITGDTTFIEKLAQKLCEQYLGE